MGVIGDTSLFTNKGTDPQNPNVASGLERLRQNQVAVREMLSALPAEELTIQDGALRPSRAAVIADTEGGAPADELAVISPQVDAADSLHPGMLLMLRSKDASRKITVKHSMGVNGIRTWDGKDVLLDTVWQLCLTLSDAGDWLEIPAGRRAYDRAEVAYDRAEAAKKAIIPPDGVTIVEQDKKLVAPVFVSPSASAPGKSGLVPGPVTKDEPGAQVLTEKGWKRVHITTLTSSWESPEKNASELVLGMLSAEGLNIDTNLNAGFFGANAFGGTLPQGVLGGLMLHLNGENSETPNLRYPHQMLYSWNTQNLYARHNTRGSTLGVPDDWTEWICVGAPKPSVGDMVGVGRLIPFSHSGTSHTVTQGGIWWVLMLGLSSTRTLRAFNGELYPGGSVINRADMGIDYIVGWEWRIA